MGDQDLRAVTPAAAHIVSAHSLPAFIPPPARTHAVVLKSIDGPHGMKEAACTSRVTL